jgi:hypothetical protein
MPGEIGPNHATSTDPGTKLGWRIEDPVTRLREWGSEHAYDLPAIPTELTLGSAQSCGLQLVDPSTHTSREHAKLVPFAGGWKIVDLESKNGLWRDGARRLEFVLTPGVEIGIGDLCFIAESPQLIALRALVCRYIGWSAWRQRDVDEALRSLRDWAARRVSLVLMGGGDLFTVARRLHAATLRGGAFVASDEQRDGMTALRSAANGTLWVPELPPDFADVAASLREVGSRTRLMLHAQSAEDAARAAITLARPAIITLPSFTSRHTEMERLILEHADVAAERLQASAPTLRMSDLDALAALDYHGFADLEDTVMRVVALRTLGLTAGSERIGISRVALMRWAERRNLET